MTDRPITDRPGFWYGFTYVLDANPLIAEESVPASAAMVARGRAELRVWEEMHRALERPTEQPLFLPKLAP